MTGVTERIAALERRLQRVEDELAIHKLIVRYGLAVDTGEAAPTVAVFAADGVYDTDVRVMQGREAVAEMVRSPHHQAMVGRCAHQIGPAVVEVDGDRAVALGYSRVYLRDDAGIGIYRVSLNRWELTRADGGWTIARRVTRLLGHAEALPLLRDGLAALARP